MEWGMISRLRLAGLVGVISCGVLLGALLVGSQARSPAIFHHPRVPVPGPPNRAAGWASSNWSGYAVTGSPSGYSSVTGRWTVTPVTRSRTQTYSSEWIGIDGYNNSNLIQTGTEADYSSGRARYYAWWEILPAAETKITTISVQPGDTMTASITKGSGSSWTITIKDVTTNKSFTTVQNYTGPQTSAEWIEEAPTVGGRVGTLANYGTATFDPGTVNSANPNLNASESGVMVQNGVQVSTPSNPDTDTDGFNAQYGSTVPAAPSS
jgi:Peptidase A4 family